MMHNSQFEYLFIYFREGEGRQKEMERNIHVREKHQLVASPICLN